MKLLALTTAKTVLALAVVSPAHAAVVSLYEKGLSFNLPASLKPMSKEVFDLKYSRMGATKPQYAYANADANISVAVSLAPGSLNPNQLAEFANGMKSALERSVKGIEWRSEQAVTLNGVEWRRLEFVAPAVDTPIYNDMYFTSLRGKPLLLNFNAVTRLEKQAKTLFIPLIKSLKVAR